jgi:hypothetical protein
VRQKKKSDQGPDDSPGVVHGPLEPESLPGFLPLNGVGQQGISRGGADSFSYAIQQPDEENLPPGRGRGDEWPGGRGDGISDHNQGFALFQAIREPAREEFQKRSRRLGYSLDQPQKGCPHPDYRSQENGQKGVYDLAAHIREKADPAQGDNILGEIPEKLSFFPFRLEMIHVKIREISYDGLLKDFKAMTMRRSIKT